MTDEKKYINSIHTLGRIGSVIAVAFMVGIPVVICAVNDCFPDLATVVQAGSGLLAMMAPTAISEVISYAPILGSASYITFITGNVMNLKLPVAISAQQMAGVEANTPEADAVSTMAIALSSLETIVIIALGVLLLKPLQPILAVPAVKTATSFMVPALFGGLMIGTFGHGGGKQYIKNKLLIAVLPMILVILGLVFIPKMTSYQGYAILAMIPVSIAWAYFLFKKGVVKMVSRDTQEAK